MASSLGSTQNISDGNPQPEKNKDHIFDENTGNDSSKNMFTEESGDNMQNIAANTTVTSNTGQKNLDVIRNENIPEAKKEMTDEDLDVLINAMENMRKSDDGTLEDFSNHPAFMTEFDPTQPMSDEMEGLMRLKYESDDPIAQAEAYKEDGNHEFQKKQYHIAIDNYTEGIKGRCSDRLLNAVLYTNRGRCPVPSRELMCLLLGNHRSALNDCIFACKFKPDHIKALHRGALCCLEMKKYEDCVTWCDRALAIDAKNSKILDVRQNAAKLLYIMLYKAVEKDKRKEQLQEKKALSVDEKLLEAIPDFSNHPAFMTEFDPTQPTSDEMEGLMRLKYESDDPIAQAEAYKEDGNHEFQKKQYHIAIDNYTEGIKGRCSDRLLNAVLYTNRAAAQSHLGNNRSALNDCIFACKFKPDHIKALHRGALCCLEMKKYEDCVTWCDRALAIDAKNSKILDVRQNAAKLLYIMLYKAVEKDKRKEQLQEKKALSVDQKLLVAIQDFSNHPAFMTEFDPTQPMSDEMEGLMRLKYAQAEAYKENGNHEFQKKQYHIAIDNYTEGIKGRCSDRLLNAVLYTNRAAAQSHLGNHRSALNDCVFACKFKPDHIKALHRGALCCLEMKKYEDCVTWCDRALAIDAKNSKILDVRQNAAKLLYIMLYKAVEKDKRKEQLQEKKALSVDQKLLVAVQKMAEGGIGCTGSESDTNVTHSSLYCRHSQNYVESLSLELCTIMTRLGYGEEMRRWRVEKYKDSDRLHNAGLTPPRNFTVITSGSKAEGLACILESDSDLLYVINGVLCLESGINLHTIPGDIDLFVMDTRVYPGHCILFQMRQRQNCLKAIRTALCDNGYGDILLSSSLWVDYWSCEFKQVFKRVHHQERAGPSIPGIVYGMYYTDTVVALRCHCPSIIQRWAARLRHWPSPAIVQKVVLLGAYVTPVGFKGSKYSHIEWRICFNTGEAELMHNLNVTQTNVYVMLKMILKEIIKPNNKEITSYVMKNIILWQAENNPQAKFHARSFFHWLHDGLRELRTAIEKKQLRYYMIPERNLMAACGLDDALQSKWVTDIKEMMEEGPRVILRLAKIRKAIVGTPEPMLWFSKKRMELETLQLELLLRKSKTKSMEKETDAIMRRFVELYRDVQQRMLLEGSRPLHWLNDMYERMLK